MMHTVTDELVPGQLEAALVPPGTDPDRMLTAVGLHVSCLGHR